MVIGALCAGSGQILMTWAFRDLPVGEGSLLLMLVPLGIAVGGALFFHEHFLAHELIGAWPEPCGFTTDCPDKTGSSLR